MYKICFFSCQTAQDLKFEEIKKFQEILEIGWRHNLVLSLPFRNETFAIAAKNYGNADIRVFWSCLILLIIFTSFQIVFPWLFIWSRILTFIGFFVLGYFPSFFSLLVIHTYIHPLIQPFAHTQTHTHISLWWENLSVRPEGFNHEYNFHTFNLIYCITEVG